MTPERVKEEVKSILRRLNILENKRIDYTSENRGYAVDTTINLVSCPFGNVTATLPSAVNEVGKYYIFKKIDNVNSLIIQADSTETIDGSNTHTLNTQYQFVTIFSDGIEWHIIGQ